MLNVLDARWSVGEAAKNGTAFKLKIASLAAAGVLAAAIVAPMGATAYADELENESSDDIAVVAEAEDGLESTETIVSENESESVNSSDSEISEEGTEETAAGESDLANEANEVESESNAANVDENESADDIAANAVVTSNGPSSSAVLKANTLAKAPEAEKTYTVDVTYRIYSKVRENSGGSHYDYSGRTPDSTETRSFTVKGNSFDLPLESNWGILEISTPTGVSANKISNSIVYNLDGTVTIIIDDSYSSNSIKFGVRIGEDWTSRFSQYAYTFGAGDSSWQYAGSMTAAVPSYDDISTAKNYQGMNPDALDIVGVHPNPPAGYHYYAVGRVDYTLGGQTTRGVSLSDFGLSIDENGVVSGTMKKLSGNEYLTLYYYYVADAYTVTYDSNNGSSDTYNGGTYYWGDTYTVVSNDETGFSYGGHTFMGWNTKADGTGTQYAVNSSFEVPQENVTLYAQWSLDLALDVAGYIGIYDGKSHTITAVANQDAQLFYSVDNGVTWSETAPAATNVSAQKVLVKAVVQRQAAPAKARMRVMSVAAAPQTVEVVSDPVDLIILPATLTVTANSYTREQGESNPLFEGAITGFVNGETVDVLSGMPSYTTEATEDSPAGEYEITALQGSLDAQNYVFEFVPGTLTVTPISDPEPEPDPDPEPTPDPAPRESAPIVEASVLPETGDANAPLGAGIVAMASGALFLASRRMSGKSKPRHARF